MAVAKTKVKELVPSEKIVHQQVADFINLQYPDVIFTSDPSGLRVTAGLRQEIARKSPKKHKVPDLIILEPKHGYNGLVLEIKKFGTKLRKKDGSFINDHIQKQANTLTLLRSKDYLARFGIGYEDCERIIKGYMAEF